MHTVIRHLPNGNKGFAVVVSGRGNERTYFQLYESHPQGKTILLREIGFSDERDAIRHFDSWAGHYL